MLSSSVPEWAFLTGSLRRMADPFVDTASQRPPTGLDASARRLIVEVVGVSAGDIARGFFQDVYSGFDDYCVAVAQVWGADEGQTLYLAIEAARHGDPMRIGRCSIRPTR